uniref:Thioredoxin n=1 Tax=Marseillevirus LCMAC103 TaxID=2506604 RepID=A0A481YWA2_9VIRU|nr:MAG: thioredoxin [Marseillevirus LCMAC103]
MSVLEKRETCFYEDSPYVRELTPRDFDDYLVWKVANGGGLCAVVIFYAPWCAHCRKFKNAFEGAARRAAFIDFWAFNCEKYRGHIEKIRSDMPKLVTTYPTILAYRGGAPSEQFGGPRTAKNLEKFAMRVCAGADPKVRE